jgi:hypothetical protein
MRKGLYVRVDTKFASHPKVLEIGPLGEALWLRGLCYAGEQMTDGFVPAAFVRRMGDIPDALAVAATLVAAGLWDEAEGGYQVHDYLDWQRGKAEIEQISTARAASGRRGGMQNGSQAKAKPDQTQSKPEANAKQNESKTEADTDTDTEPEGDTPPEGPPHGADAPHPLETQPVAGEVPAEPPKEPPKRRQRLPGDFVPSVALKSWAANELGLAPAAIDYETEKFCDHFRGNGDTKLDWPLTWKNWMRRVSEGTFNRGRASPTRASNTPGNLSNDELLDIIEGRVAI